MKLVSKWTQEVPVIGLTPSTGIPEYEKPKLGTRKSHFQGFWTQATFSQIYQKALPSDQTKREVGREVERVEVRGVCETVA